MKNFIDDIRFCSASSAYRTIRWLMVGWVILCGFPIYAGELVQRPEVQAFIEHMVAKYSFERSSLTALFERIELQQRIIDIMNRPAESKPWYEYRSIFVNDARIQGGVEFWRHHRDTLAQAEQDYGVDPAVITAIIGVETRYGRYTGSYRVIDALSTLGFDYPRRAKFFQAELESYLLLTREEGIDPLHLKGSYAGAMGLPQFMPSSFRRYAVDFEGDGKRDLWTNPVDAIGSVANYLKVHGWQSKAPVVVPARVDGVLVAGLSTGLQRPSRPLSDLKDHGLTPEEPVADDLPAILVKLEEAENQFAYWAGFHNFYVITRYNRSPLYAMAVYQLSRAISKAVHTADSHTQQTGGADCALSTLRAATN